MKSLLALGTLAVCSIFALNAFAEIDARVECKDIRTVIKYSDEGAESYSKVLLDNRIKIVSPTFDLKNLQEFLAEYFKVPDRHRMEMLKNEASIHLIHGGSVMDDPTWDPNNQVTFDGRLQSSVAGSGGNPAGLKKSRKYIKSMQKYCSYTTSVDKDECDKDWTKEEPKDYPTRIVLNHMNSEKGLSFHGSVNVTLHEYGHGMDNLFESGGVSKSKNWQLIFNNKEIRDYMAVACKRAEYCLENANEAFAELFAYYTSCDETRDHMVKNSPILAKYFEKLSLKKESTGLGMMFVSSSLIKKTPYVYKKN